MSGRGIRGSLIFQTGEASAPLQSSNFRAQLQARSNDTVYGPKKKKKKKKNPICASKPRRETWIYIFETTAKPRRIYPRIPIIYPPIGLLQRPIISGEWFSSSVNKWKKIGSLKNSFVIYRPLFVERTDDKINKMEWLKQGK